ncbi:MAG: molybdate ABC transporter substrate-binding protein [Sulfurimonas sp.]|jgi:molybdate transport system substrate-binding protein
MKKIILGLMILSMSLFAEKITVFAAADLRFALDEVKAKFLKEHPKDEVETIYGSSGKGMHQIENGAPYDIYFSANEAFVEDLYKGGFVTTEPKLYAKGRIVIWSKNPNFDPKKGFDNMKEPWVKKIAIANPSHAPYGEKAKQAMQSIGIYKEVESKLVLGENISQTTQFIQSGAADIGVIAYSLALAPTIAKSEHPNFHLIDGNLHQPLLQGYGITKVGANKPLTKEFYNFMDTKEAQTIMQSYGFVVN